MLIFLNAFKKKKKKSLKVYIALPWTIFQPCQGERMSPDFITSREQPEKNQEWNTYVIQNKALFSLTLIRKNKTTSKAQNAEG